MKDFFKMDVTKEELEFLTEQLKSFRKKEKIRTVAESITEKIDILWGDETISVAEFENIMNDILINFDYQLRR